MDSQGALGRGRAPRRRTPEPPSLAQRHQMNVQAWEWSKRSSVRDSQIPKPRAGTRGPGVLPQKPSSSNSLSAVSGASPEGLELVGRQCFMQEDDDLYSHFCAPSPRCLVAWKDSPSLMLDRFDVRHLLDRLPAERRDPLLAPPGGRWERGGARPQSKSPLQSTGTGHVPVSSWERGSEGGVSEDEGEEEEEAAGGADGVGTSEREHGRSRSRKVPRSEEELDVERFRDLAVQEQRDREGGGGSGLVPSEREELKTDPSATQEAEPPKKSAFAAVPYSYDTSLPMDSSAGQATGSGREDNTPAAAAPPPPFTPPVSLPVSFTGSLPETEKHYAIMLKTARFVAQNGAQSEIVLRVRQGNSPAFGFLMPGHPLHAFFRLLVAHPPPADPLPAQKSQSGQSPALQQQTQHHPQLQQEQQGGQSAGVKAADSEGKGTEVGGSAISLLGVQYGDSSEEDEDVDEDGDSDDEMQKRPKSAGSEKTATEGARSEAGSKRLRDDTDTRAGEESHEDSEHPQKQLRTMGSEPSAPGTEASVDASPGTAPQQVLEAVEPVPPGVAQEPGEADARIVLKMVEYIARNGREFEAVVRHRDEAQVQAYHQQTGVPGVPRFPFLDPSHVHHAFFSYHLQRALAGPPQQLARTTGSEEVQGDIWRSENPLGSPAREDPASTATEGGGPFLRQQEWTGGAAGCAEGCDAVLHNSEEAAGAELPMLQSSPGQRIVGHATQGAGEESRMGGLGTGASVSDGADVLLLGSSSWAGRDLKAGSTTSAGFSAQDVKDGAGLEPALQVSARLMQAVRTPLAPGDVSSAGFAGVGQQQGVYREDDVALRIETDVEEERGDSFAGLEGADLVRKRRLEKARRLALKLRESGAEERAEGGSLSSIPDAARGDGGGGVSCGTPEANEVVGAQEPVKGEPVAGSDLGDSVPFESRLLSKSVPGSQLSQILELRRAIERDPDDERGEYEVVHSERLVVGSAETPAEPVGESSSVRDGSDPSANVPAEIKTKVRQMLQGLRAR